MPEHAATPGLDDQRFQREWWLTALLALSVLVLMTAMHWGQSPGYAIYDQIHRWRAPQASTEVVVVAIDDQSLDALGGWPLQRHFYADLLRLLAPLEHRPQAVGFDLLFIDPSPWDTQLANQMRQHRVVLATEQAHAHGQLQQRMPVATLSQAATSLAHINISFESDGVIRGAHLLQGDYPHLALALSGQNWPANERHSSYRRFVQAGLTDGVPTVSLSDVLSGQMPLSFFKDKYVLVGATAPSLGDQIATAHAGQNMAGTPGVMLHALLLNGLLTQELIAPVHTALQHLLGMLALLSVLLALRWLSPLTELAVTLSTAAGTVLLSVALLLGLNLWFDPGLPLMAMALLKPVWAWRRSDMVARFLRQSIQQLERTPRPTAAPTHSSATAPVPHPRGDTVGQYAHLLNLAIDDTQSHLQFLTRLISEIPNALLVADADQRIALLNPRMHDGLPAGLLQEGHPLLPLLYYLGLPPNPHLPKLTGKDQYVSAIDNQGVLRHYIFHLAQVPRNPGEAPWWVLVLSDITDMRQLQNSREKTLQLLSHDMRTPIASIIALTRAPKPGSESVLHKSEDIARHAHTLLNMMDDFIFSIRAQAPQYALTETLIDSLVDEAIFQVKDLAQSRHMRLVQHFDDNPQFVRADQRLLTRMLVNLLVNAVRYGQPHTDIHIRLSHDEVPQLPGAGWANLSLVNTVGQADPSQAVTMNGFGLGIEFVKTVVSKHAGHIQFDLPTTPGAQAHVLLQLPLVDLT
jgi:CHASE2 domain-containing sensor protein